MVIASAVLGLAVVAAPAQAATVTTACQKDLATASSPSVSSSGCDGYYTGNLLGGTTDDLKAQSDSIKALLGSSFTVTKTMWDSMNSSGLVVTSLQSGLLSFNQALYGDVVIGVHVGNTGSVTTPTYENQSVFFLFQGLNGQTTIDLGGLTQGFSNAALYNNTPAVPEPATWAMMLLGFGGIGMAMRRNRQRSGTLLQVA
jgi:hypothetical protein